MSIKHLLIAIVLLGCDPDNPAIMVEYGDSGIIEGVDGQNGANGEAGSNGLDGEDGNQGAQGDQGAQGEPGLNGSNGQNGLDGEDGLAGTDGSNGTNGQTGIQGPKGDKGDQGIPGPGTRVVYTGTCDSSGYATVNIGASADDMPMIKVWIYNDNEQGQAFGIGWYVGMEALKPDGTYKIGFPGAASAPYRVVVIY